MQRIGEWKIRYRHGVLQEQVPHEGGRINGEVTRFYASGSLQETQQYLEDLPNGLRFRYTENGKLIVADSWTNGYRNGPSFEYSANGKLRAQQFYQNDTLIGWQHLSWQDGTPNMSTWFSDTGKTWVIHRLPFAQIRDTINAQLGATPWVRRYSNGNCWVVGKCINGLREGEFRYYTEDGTWVATENYQFDQLQGTFRQFYPGSENIRVEGFFTNGEPDSVWKWLNPDGSVRRIGSFREGVEWGPWLELNLAGQVVERSYYREGKLHGPQSWLSTNGDTLVTLFYSAGELVPNRCWPKAVFIQADSALALTGQCIWLRPDSSVIATLELLVGQPHGSFLVFNPNKMPFLHRLAYLPSDTANKPLIHKRFRFGVVHGKQLLYHPNGNLEKLEEYNQGEPEGQWRWFDENGKLLRREKYEYGLQHGPTELFEPGNRLPVRTEIWWDGYLIQVK
jgi:antitoxin component YwqK of YwqJK toxin-antitoxin module